MSMNVLKDLPSPTIRLHDPDDESQSIEITSTATSFILSFFAGVYNRIFTKSVGRSTLVCKDAAGIFGIARGTAGSGVYTKDSVSISSFIVTPSVITEGGFISFGGTVNNYDSFGDRTDTGEDNFGAIIQGNDAYCAIVNLVTGSTVLSFDVDQLNVSIDDYWWF